MHHRVSRGPWALTCPLRPLSVQPNSTPDAAVTAQSRVMLSSIALSLSAVSAAATPMNSLAFLNHRHPLHLSSSTTYRGRHKASHPPITSFPFPSADVSSLRYSNSQFEEVKHEENCTSTSTSEIGSRRSFLASATSIAASASTLLGVPSYAHAAKGAAEYDLEYYLRDVL